MLYRTIPKVKEQLSILGMGCMRLPQIDQNDPKTIDEARAIEIVRYAIDRGVNYVDTAYTYHNSESEPFLKRALGNGYREKVQLATKLPSWLIQKDEDPDRYLNEQLERLGTETIDFYLLHGLKRDRWQTLKRVRYERFLDRAIRDSKIRYAGFSFHGDRSIFKEIIDEYDWTFCQIQYNYLDEHFQAGKEGLEYAYQKGIGVIVMEPLRGGKIAGQVPETIMSLWNEAPQKRTPAEWGLRWVWNHPEVSVVLSGMSTLDQLKENLRTAEQGEPHSLTKEELRLVERVNAEYKRRIKVNCTNCGYCLSCPNNVNIPDCFSRYNGAFLFDNVEEAKKNYLLFVPQAQRASQCIACGECEGKCPQQLPIRDLLRDVVQLFEASAN